MLAARIAGGSLVPRNFVGLAPCRSRIPVTYQAATVKHWRLTSRACVLPAAAVLPFPDTIASAGTLTDRDSSAIARAVPGWFASNANHPVSKIRIGPT